MTNVKPDVIVEIYGIGGEPYETEAGDILTTEAGEILEAQGTWADVTADVIRGGITAKYGIMGSGPTTRVGQTGVMKFLLRNDPGSSGSVLGYHSPDHANAREGFEIGKAMRLIIGYSGSTRYKWVGRLDTIKPVPGIVRSRQTRCTAVDWFDIAGNTKVALQGVQFNVRADEGIAAVVSSMPNLPTASTLATGQDTFPTIFDSSRDESTSVTSELAKLVMSELGFLYIKANATTGGELVFEDRHQRAKYGGATACISGSMRDLDADRTTRNIFNKVKVEVNPREIDASASVLYTLQSVPLVPVSGSLVIEGRYTDPVQRGTLRIGGASMVPSASTTDYLMNSASDGGGDDLTATFTVTACYGGNTVRYEVINDGDAGYITLLQARGKAIAIREPSISERGDTDSIESYGESVLKLSMPYQEDMLVADDTATDLLATWKDPITVGKKVSFYGNHSDALMKCGLLCEPGDKVFIEEEVTGIGKNYFINGIEISIDKNFLIKFTWYLAVPEIAQAWLLGIVGESELGETTFLGR